MKILILQLYKYDNDHDSEYSNEDDNSFDSEENNTDTTITRRIKKYITEAKTLLPDLPEKFSEAHSVK